MKKTERHHWFSNILSVAQALGVLIFIWGLVFLEIWPVLLGGIIVIIAKLWFSDRMVWLYGDRANGSIFFLRNLNVLAPEINYFRLFFSENAMVE